MTMIQKEAWILWSCGIRIHWEKINLLKESKPTWTSSSSNYFKHGMVKSEKLPWKRELSIRCGKWEPRSPWAAPVECLHELPPWSRLLTVWIVWPLHIHPGTTTSSGFAVFPQTCCPLPLDNSDLYFSLGLMSSLFSCLDPLEERMLQTVWFLALSAM